MPIPETDVPDTHPPEADPVASKPKTEEWSAGAVAILDAAERLMGRYGIEGVSLRQITIAAKMGNNSAIAYHFGDRYGLLLAVSRGACRPSWRNASAFTMRP